MYKQLLSWNNKLSFHGTTSLLQLKAKKEKKKKRRKGKEKMKMSVVTNDTDKRRNIGA